MADIHKKGVTLFFSSVQIDDSKKREYDFPVQTNFCNTFCVCSVLPFETKLSHTEVLEMQQDIDIFRVGLAAYAREDAAAKLENRPAIHTNHVFKPSVFR